MQMPDGNHYRIPLSGSCGKHREGDKVYIIYPPDNPLQARLNPGSPAKNLSLAASRSAGSCSLHTVSSTTSRSEIKAQNTQITHDIEVDKTIAFC